MQKNMFKISGLIIILPALAFVLTGCGKSLSEKAGEKIAEKTMENAIKDSMGGKADVDVSNGNLKIDNEKQKMEIGEDVKLPDDFPSDVYVIDGEIKSAITDKEKEAYSLTIETDKSVSEVTKEYEEKLKSEGWKVTATMNIGDSASMAGEKDDRTTTVIIGKGDEKTTVVISTEKD